MRVKKVLSCLAHPSLPEVVLYIMKCACMSPGGASVHRGVYQPDLPATRHTPAGGYSRRLERPQEETDH